LILWFDWPIYNIGSLDCCFESQVAPIITNRQGASRLINYFAYSQSDHENILHRSFKSYTWSNHTSKQWKDRYKMILKTKLHYFLYDVCRGCVTSDFQNKPRPINPSRLVADSRGHICTWWRHTSLEGQEAFYSKSLKFMKAVKSYG
jgi:hypothetical protein